MPQKPPFPPAQPSRTSAPHVQAAVARAAQAKLPDRPASQAHPQPDRVPNVMHRSSPQAAHVQKALAAVQAKRPEFPPAGRLPAVHVQNAVASVQRKVSMPAPKPRQAASYVSVTPGRGVQARRASVPMRAIGGPAVVQLAARVIALSDVEVVKYDNPMLKAGVQDKGIVERAKALAASFGSALEPIETADLKAMTNADDLYIYGHGGYAAGGQMILTAATLAQRLHDRGLRAIKTICLKGCKAGSGYVREVADAVEAIGIKLSEVTGTLTWGSTDLATGASLALTVEAQEKVDRLRALDLLDPLGGFNGAEINQELKTGTRPVSASGSLVTVPSLASFDPLRLFG
jgi:hypothetical protein